MELLKNIFICPLCKAPLIPEGKSFFCTGARRHCYDASSSGYVNLLAPGKASNAKTGDDREMLRARRDFLGTGKYKRISDILAQCAVDSLGRRESITFVDAGCGEGYHTLNIEKNIRDQSITPCAIGFDASKYGADTAAKRAAKSAESSARFAAANIFSMPLPDRCANAVFSMFAPIPAAEALRVLKDDGVLCVCSAGSMHLWEMRQVLYGEPRISPPLSAVPEGFAPISSVSDSYRISLDSHEEIHSLFAMTPFWCHCPAEGRERLESMDTLEVRVETVYNVYKKANNQ